jgi:hypothetical protein
MLVETPAAHDAVYICTGTAVATAVIHDGAARDTLPPDR